MLDEEALRDTPWHTHTAREVISAFETDVREGLSTGEARRRLERFGPNAIRSGDALPWWSILRRQFADPLIYILLAAGLVVLAIREYADAGVILAVVIINAAIGFFQEWRARKTIRALSVMSDPRGRVVRGGEQLDVPTDDLVPGDALVLAAGSRASADVRLVEADDLQVDESALTGESRPVDKQTSPVDDEKAVPGDQFCMAFAGTNVTRGRAVGIVVRTGPASQLGRIAEKTQEIGRVETPIKEKMDRLGKVIGAGIGVLVLLVGFVGLLQEMALRDVIETAVALAVGAVPEALPVVLTVALAVGVRRMAERNAIIRSLPAVETLGSTTVVSSDKTGTLTKNEMTVRVIWAGGHRYDVSGSGYSAEGELRRADSHEPNKDPDDADRVQSDRADSDQHADAATHGEALKMTLLTGLLASETESLPAGEEATGGDPTEVALLVSGVKGGYDLTEVRERHPQMDIIRFDSERQFMATINDMPDGPCAFLKGSPEAVLARCSRRAQPDGAAKELDEDASRETAYRLAREGYRVLAMAYRQGGGTGFGGSDPGSEFVLAGFQAMEDPVRPEAIEAVRAAYGAGMRVVMLTGDHVETAQAVGKKLGLASEGSGVAEGRDLEGLSDTELDELLGEVDVYARVSPEHKLRLIERLKAQDQIVAVTGDGVNDAPALQAAHLGISMGQAGTDVAREASDMVLADDNFASIPSAVEEGRLAFANIRKVTYFLLSTGIAEVLTILFTLSAGWPLPFIAVQVLWINLVTNGLQDIALAFERGEPGMLDEPPRDPGENVINREVVWRLGSASSFIAVCTLGVFWWMLQQNVEIELVRSVTMTQMVMFQFFHVFNSRSMRRSAFQIPLSANPFLAVSVMGAIVIHIGALHVPFMQGLFGTRPIDLEHWMLVTGVGALVLLFVEAEKYVLRRRDGR